MSDDPYSRVYWRIRSDERFVGIYTDNHHLATWLRLLISADAVWPAPADVPRSARQASVDALARVGLIELLPGDLFRVHGLDKERSARSTKARESVMHRYNDRTTTVERPKYDRTTSRAEPSQDEPSIARTRDGLPNLNSAVAQLWQDATGRSVIASGAFAIEYLDDACHRHPPSEVGAAIVRARKTFDRIPSTQALAAAVRAILDPLPDSRAVVAVEDTAKRRATARRDRLLTNHSGGYHIDAPDPDCPKCKEGAA